jgi:dTDP-glucose pyrophosphorylase
MKKEEIVGVILAAGRGIRIKPISLKYPKPLIPIGNKPIILHQIEQMKTVGIKKIIIVVGYLKSRIYEYLGDGVKFNVEIKYVHQESALGIAHAVGQLENHIHGPFLLFLGDIFVVTKNLKSMITEFTDKKANSILAVKKEANLEFIKRNFAVIRDKNGLVKRVIEKPRYVVNRLKGCGIYLFDLHIFDAIRETPRTAMRDEYEITDSIQILINYGYRVYAKEVIEWDMNITTPLDIIKCNLEFLTKMKLNNLISKDAIIQKNTKIKNSTIGKRVIINYPISIENSVVFSGTKITKRKSVSNCIVTPYGITEYKII